jgi:acyl-coenzyme A synthetase/AMP-(fatty) acid ligase
MTRHGNHRRTTSKRVDPRIEAKAFVVRQPAVQLTTAEVMDFVANNVAPYKKVRAVEFIHTIPKSASGKILRKVLKSS